jgi:hypothetical protein
MVDMQPKNAGGLGRTPGQTGAGGLGRTPKQRDAGGLGRTPRQIFLFAIVFVLGLAVAAPAFAQTKDPFEPNPGGGQTQDPGTGGDSSGDDPFEPSTGNQQPAAQETNDPNDPTTPPTTEPAPTVEPEPQSTVGGTLSNTGADVETWGGVGYLLIVLGACALIVGWMFAPVPHRRRRG